MLNWWLWINFRLVHIFLPNYKANKPSVNNHIIITLSFSVQINLKEEIFLNDIIVLWLTHAPSRKRFCSLRFPKIISGFFLFWMYEYIQCRFHMKWYCKYKEWGGGGIKTIFKRKFPIGPYTQQWKNLNLMRKSFKSPGCSKWKTDNRVQYSWSESYWWVYIQRSKHWSTPSESYLILL